jgi:predicted DCC family thiol-disulfide oxidoreductase YuxK
MSETVPDSNVARPPKGWILYDGGCGFCFRWVHFWEKVVARRGFELKDLQSAKEEGILQVSADNLLDGIRVLKVDGGLECGADAYLFVAKHIWWARPIAILFGLPGFNWVLWGGYRWFNRNRYRVSQHCPLPEKSLTTAKKKL